MGTAQASEIVIRPRFRGEDGCAHAGYVCGLLGSRIPARPVQVTLTAAARLETSLQVRSAGVTGHLIDGDGVVAEAAPSVLEAGPPPPVSLEQSRLAAATFPGFSEHPAPECFVCGPRRSGRDGLRIFPGPVKGRPVVAAPWIPDVALAAAGTVSQEYVWAALECPAGWATAAAQPMSHHLMHLAAFTVHLRADVRPDVPAVAVGWHVRSDAGRHVGGSALHTTDGTLLAYATAVWTTHLAA